MVWGVLGLFWADVVIGRRDNGGVKSSAEQSQRTEALATIAAGFNQLYSVGLRPVDDADAVGLIKELEQIRRRTEHAAAGLLNQIEIYDFHTGDGYASPKAMVRHHAQLSNAEIMDRHRRAKLCVDLPEIDAAAKSGEVPVDNINQLGRAYANPRIKHEVMDQETWLVGEACELRPPAFRDKLRDWVELHDQDGPEPEADRQHKNRSYRLTQNFNNSFTGDHNHGSMQGAAMQEILSHYEDAEFRVDWEQAKLIHGDDTALCHLERTPQQRRADALFQIYQDAAANPDGAVPVNFVHNLVWTQETFEYFQALYYGAEPDPMHPDDYRCETINGVRVNPIEAVASAIISKVRRAVVDAKGTIIDLGEARNYRGSARLAVQLSSTECVWPSCHTPTTRCETDHMQEHSKRGRTNPGNGAPLCGKHNRWKQKGFTVHKDPQGQWHTHRPDGTEIDP